MTAEERYEDCQRREAELFSAKAYAANPNGHLRDIHRQAVIEAFEAIENRRDNGN